MSVNQVEEYYIYLSKLEIDGDQKAEIESLLDDEGYSNYEFQDDDTVLVVDDIQSEYDGESLEEQIKAIYS